MAWQSIFKRNTYSMVRQQANRDSPLTETQRVAGPQSQVHPGQRTTDAVGLYVRGVAYSDTAWPMLNLECIFGYNFVAGGRDFIFRTGENRPRTDACDILRNIYGNEVVMSRDGSTDSTFTPSTVFDHQQHKTGIIIIRPCKPHAMEEL